MGQSPDIAGGVHVGKEDLDVGAGDQGIMFGYASDETEDCMPLTHSMATKLGKKLTDVRKSGELWWLRPDGKTQVTIQYVQKPDGFVEPQKIHTVVISSHAEPGKAVRTKEVEGYTVEEMTAPSMEEMNRLIEEKVIRATLAEIKLKNGQPPSPCIVSTPTTTSTQLASSSLVVLREMLVLLAVRSSLTPMEVGVPMEVVPSLERIQPSWTALQHTSAVKWQNPL